MNWTAPLLLAALPLFGLGVFPQAQETEGLETQSPLFNQTGEQILNRVGPPDRIAMGPGEFMRWIWLQEKTVGTTVTFFGKRAVQVQGELPVRSPQVSAQPIPSEGPYLGQPLEQLLHRMGPPDAVQSPPSPFSGHRQPAPSRGSILEYGDRWIYLGADMVVGIGPRQVPAVHGPR